MSSRASLPNDLRVFALAFANPDEWSHFEHLVPEAQLTVEALVDLHRIILGCAALDGEHTHAALEALYTRSSWLGRRIVLSKLGEEHAAVLPVLVKIAPAVDAMTRVAAIEAMRRMGHVAAEPYLVHVLEEQRDAQSMAAAASALAAMGTLASLPALRALESFDTGRSLDIEQVRWRSASAIEQILERFPMKAAQGGLTLAEEHTVSGALTLAGASEGDISLYEAMRSHIEATHEQRQQALTRADGGGATLAPLDEPFQRLVPGPRRVPLGYYAEIYGFLHGMGLITWPFMAALLALLPSMLAMDLGLALFFLVFTHGIPLLLMAAIVTSKSMNQTHLLTHGTPTYGQLDERRVEEVRTGNGVVHQHTYTFKYMTEDQRIESAERVFNARMKKLEDEPFEALLYHKGEIVLFDEFRNLTVDEDGQLTTATGRTLAYAIAPAIYLAVLLVVLAQSIGVVVL